MHLTHILIHEIVNVDELPSHALGTAAFSNGRSYEFYAYFGHGYGDQCVFIQLSPDPRQHMTDSPRTTEAIKERLGFTEIARRERDAIAAFEYERVTACQQLIRTTPS